MVTDLFVSVLRAAKIEGFETKSIGRRGWHAFRVTLLVDSNDETIKTSGPPCPECGRPAQKWGLHKKLADLSIPAGTNTFFTTKTGWPSAPFYDREVFISEEIAWTLKNNHIKGGYCSRLLSEDDCRKLEEGQRRGVDLYPFLERKRHVEHLLDRATAAGS